MQYAKVEDGIVVQYPYSFRQMQADYPLTIFDASDPQTQAIAFGRYPVIDEPPEHDSGKQYVTPRPVSEWTVGPDSVTVTYQTKSYTTAERRTRMIEELKQRRWEVEIEGVTVTIDGEEVPVATRRGDERNQLHMEFTRIMSGTRPDPSTFNFDDGKPRQVSTADMSLAINTALAHVQAAFDREASLTSAIENASSHGQLDTILAEIRGSWT